MTSAEDGPDIREGGETAQGSCYNEDAYEFIQKVLDRSRVCIVEGVPNRDSARQILDVFREEGTFGENTHIMVRDLEDALANKTSNCLREICDAFRRNPNIYVKLKSALARTGHRELLETVEQIETNCHDELKGQLSGCSCTEDSRCAFQEQFRLSDTLPSIASRQTKALQQHLIDLYSADCDWTNPITGDEHGIISQMYTRPEIKITRQRNQNKDSAEVQQGQRENEDFSYKHILYNSDEPCKNIYITGDAGMGKTTFCKQLVYTWCKAIQDIAEEGDKGDDLRGLKEFKYLFYVNLREVGSQYHIEDMIKENLLRDAPSDLSVSDILKTEKCLVVLDGLDEWSCPQGASICRGLNKDIPGRNTMTKTCVYLTTTRNWKFDIMNLKTKDVDTQVELCGFDETSLVEFAEKVVGTLRSTSQNTGKRPIRTFFKEIDEKNLTSLTKIPVILTQFLTLWYFGRELGKSQVQLYCKMLDLLFEQASKHLSERTSTVKKPIQADSTLPECFDEEDSCLNHAQLLLCLSKLAFMSLLNKKKDESLVFKSTRLDVFGIDAADIRLLLHCGIFTQNKVLGNPTGRFKKFSFLHMKLQEFLAAVYLVTSDNLEKNMMQVREYCDKLDTTLEMGQMLMFVCGMNVDVGNQLLDHLTSVASADLHVQTNRQRIWEDNVIDDIQSCVMSCAKEGASNGLSIRVSLQDFVLDNDTISDYVQHVVEHKNTSIKSLGISTRSCNTDHVTLMLQHLQELQSLEKLCLWDPTHAVPDSLLASVISNNTKTLSSLCLSGVDLFSEVLFTTVLRCIPYLRGLSLGLRQLEEILFHEADELLSLDLEKAVIEKLKREEIERQHELELLNVDLTNIVLEKQNSEMVELHEELEQTLVEEDIEAKRPAFNELVESGTPDAVAVTHLQLKQLLLAKKMHLSELQLNLHCTDHQGKCRPLIDLTGHTNLRVLILESIMYVTNLHVVAQSVEYVSLWDVTVAYNALKQFIEALAQTSNQVEVRLDQVTIAEDRGDPVDLAAFLGYYDTFAVTDCAIMSDKRWDVEFHKK